MAHVLVRRAALGLGLAALAWAVPAAAAQADYFLKIDGVEGESAARDGHKEWIELNSLRFAGGVRVAVGDVDGDGRSDTARPRSRPAGPGTVAAPGGAQPVGLLLPAVQKVREAAARTRAWPGCRPGQKLTGVSLREGASGRIVRVLDATVTRCSAEQVSLNFSKVE